MECANHKDGMIPPDAMSMKQQEIRRNIFNGWETVNLNTATGTQVEAKAPVIISASRATDIPAFHMDWFMARLLEGHTEWRNPFNGKDSMISFAKTRLVVFWSKNPAPALPYLEKIDMMDLNYYFHFTLNNYEGTGLEPCLPGLMERVGTFRTLAGRIGMDRVIWRFDPLVISGKLGTRALIERIDHLAGMLNGFTRKIVFSFADINRYRKVRARLARTGMKCREINPDEMIEMAGAIAETARRNGLEAATCAEDIEYPGVSHNRCIDDDLVARIFPHDKRLMTFMGRDPGNPLIPPAKRPVDKGQRKNCGCIPAKDIGTYDTCRHDCLYCYANSSGPVRAGMQCISNA